MKFIDWNWNVLPKMENGIKPWTANDENSQFANEKPMEECRMPCVCSSKLISQDWVEDWGGTEGCVAF